MFDFFRFMIISYFRIFYKVITFYYAFCGATFPRYAVSLNSQCYFTQERLHEKKKSFVKERKRQNILPNICNKKKSTRLVYERSPPAKTKLDLKNCPIHASNNTTADIPKLTSHVLTHRTFENEFFGKENLVEARHLLLAHLAAVYFTRTFICKDQRTTRRSQDGRYKKKYSSSC